MSTIELTFSSVTVGDAALVSLAGDEPKGGAIKKRKEKKNATIKLSAANAAATISGSILMMSDNATKFTAPPIYSKRVQWNNDNHDKLTCRAHNAAAIFFPPFMDFIGINQYAPNVPSTVPREPIRKIVKSFPVTLKHFFKSASYNRKAIAKGTKYFNTVSYITDDVGRSPVLHAISPKTIVMRGPDNISPIFVFSA